MLKVLCMTVSVLMRFWILSENLWRGCRFSVVEPASLFVMGARVKLLTRPLQLRRQSQELCRWHLDDGGTVTTHLQVICDRVVGVSDIATVTKCVPVQLRHAR